MERERERERRGHGLTRTNEGEATTATVEEVMSRAIVSGHGGYDAAEHGNRQNKSEIINYIRLCYKNIKFILLIRDMVA
jgi:hypothetical protein